MNLRYFLQFNKGFNKGLFFVKNFSRYCIPRAYYRWRLKHILKSLSSSERELAEKRAAYYNRLPHGVACNMNDWVKLADYKFPFGAKKKFSTYFFDLYDCVKYFAPRYRMAYLFGDVTEVPDVPTFVKSRPIIRSGFSNSVLLKLNKVRHFVFVKDTRSFAQKKDMLVSRNHVDQPHRRLLLEMYEKSPWCDVGQINRNCNLDKHPEWLKGYLTIPQQLEYKFICCIEGNDVATNLKWVMSSNSLAVMPKPKYETWFMEGTLIPNYHYVEIKDDYSDLIEKMQYYIEHTDEAEQIIKNANNYVKGFQDKKLERAVSLMVMQEYFNKTLQ